MTKLEHSALEMSTPTPRVVLCGAIAVRPADEVRAELERACRRDRKTIATPIPKPATGAPLSFRIVQGPPLPSAPPPRHAQVDQFPAASTAKREAAAADMTAAIKRASEAAIAPLLRIATVSAAPRSAAPKETEDHYDLRRWRRWSARWDE